jgi:hypothetical protein
MSRNLLVKFTEIATLNKEMYIDILRSLRVVVRRTHHKKMENQHLVSPSPKCSSTSVDFGQRFLRKKSVSTLEHPLYCPEGDAADF